MQINHHGGEHTITCNKQELVAIKAALVVAGQFERRIGEAAEAFREAEKVAVAGRDGTTPVGSIREPISI